MRFGEEGSSGGSPASPRWRPPHEQPKQKLRPEATFLAQHFGHGFLFLIVAGHHSAGGRSVHCITSTFEDALSCGVGTVTERCCNLGDWRKAFECLRTAPVSGTGQE